MKAFDKLMNMEISRKKFLLMLGATLLSISALPKIVLANITTLSLRDESGNKINIINNKRSITAMFDGAGEEIQDEQVTYIKVPYSGTITGWHIAGDVSGSISIEVWKKSTFPPTVTEIISGSEPVTLSSEQSNSDTNLSTWTTSINEGDWVAFSVSSATTVTKVWLSLVVEASS